jgi:allantoin racemase
MRAAGDHCPDAPFSEVTGEAAVKIKYIVPYPFGPEGVRLRADQIPPELYRPDVSFDFVPVRNSCKLADSHYEAAILEAYVVEAGVTAEEEGYDAVVMDSIADPGIDTLRSRLSIPVIGPGQVAYHLACILGQRFSIVTMWNAWSFYYTNVLRNSGLNSDVLASIRSVDIHPDIEHLLGDDYDAIVEQLTQAAMSAIAEDGAEVIVLGSTTMHQAGQYMAAHLPCPVINPGPAAVAIAQAVVDLRLSHSKVTWPSPRALQDETFFSLIGADGLPRTNGGPASPTNAISAPASPPGRSAR